MPTFLRQATDKQEETIRLIQTLVECESPSHDDAATRRLSELLADSTGDIAKARWLGNKHLRLEFKLPAPRSAPPVLVLAHSDTVWEQGTLKIMPFRRDNGRLWGPGVLDMKGGIAFFLMAMRILQEQEMRLPNKVIMLIVADEEIGSPTSRAHTEAEARKARHVLVLEPGTGLDGKLKTERKGVGDYHLRITGKASHAGVDFENGASAILEAARQIEHIAAMTHLERGVTVNPGVIHGGTRTNVVAAEARIDIDIRVKRMRDAESLDRKLRSLKPVDQRCRLQMEGKLNRPPMERTKAIAALFTAARKISAGLGVDVEESSTGGASDGNFTAALGIPTLDGLGAVGEGAHAANESILVDRIPDRVALLAGLLSQ